MNDASGATSKAGVVRPTCMGASCGSPMSRSHSAAATATTAMTDARPATGFHTSEPDPWAAARSPWRNAGSPSPRANSAAEVNRSAGSRSSALRTAASTLAGMDGRSFAGETGSPEMIFPNTAWAVLPVKGGSPTSIS